MVDGWRNRQRGTLPVRPGLPARGASAVTIRCHGEQGRRSDGVTGLSGPEPDAPELRLHLVMLPPGTRSRPCLHPDAGSVVYVVSGEAEVWHGTGLADCSAVRAGDVLDIPPGAPHLAVNRGEVTAIAVAARPGAAGRTRPAAPELPGHLAGLLCYPVAAGD